LKEDENGSVLKVFRAEQVVEANDQEYEPVRRIAKELKMF
jgi:ABC-type phosphate/phosphonate transport system substrate-binding protein